AGLWKKLVPPLMCEDLPRRAALDRTSSGDRIPELRVARVRGEVGVVGEASGRPRLARSGRKRGVTRRGRVSGWNAGQRLRRLKREPRQRLCELLGAEERARRRAGRHTIGEGARGKWTEAVFQSQSAKRQEPPFVKIAPRDLAY